MSRYLEYVTAELLAAQNQKRQVDPKGPTPGRIASWHRWNAERSKRRHSEARQRDRDLSGRMAAYLAGQSQAERDGIIYIGDLRERFAPHNRANIGAALRAAGWLSVKRQTPRGRCWHWVRGEGPLAPRW